MVAIAHHPRGFCSHGIQRCPQPVTDCGTEWLVGIHTPLGEHGSFTEIPIMRDALGSTFFLTSVEVQTYNIFPLPLSIPLLLMKMSVHLFFL